MSKHSDEDDIQTDKNLLIDGRAVAAVQSRMVSRHTVERLADVFKIMGDPSRVKIIYALLQTELCVSDLAAVVGISQSGISHQLRLLRDARLVKTRRDGQTVFYSLDDYHIINLLSECLEHIKEQ